MRSTKDFVWGVATAVYQIEGVYNEDGKVWTRVIWDVTAVAWLLNDYNRFMDSRIIPTPIPTYDNFNAENPNGHHMRYAIT